MLDDDVLDALRHDGSSIVEFDSLDIAHTVFQQIEDATEAVANIDLYVVLYANGHSWLSIDQHSDVPQIGRASCRESVCQYVYTSVVAVALNKTRKYRKQNRRTQA